MLIGNIEDVKKLNEYHKRLDFESESSIRAGMIAGYTRLFVAYKLDLTQPAPGGVYIPFKIEEAKEILPWR
jgi:hypothetical protein